MKTQSTSAVADKKNDLVQEVKLAVEGAPSHARLIAAKTKLEELRAKANGESGEIDRLAGELAKGKQNATERAKELLAGRPVADTAISDSIKAAQRRLEVIQEAVSLQTRTVRELENALSSEVNASLKKVRQPIVSRMASALKELRAAAAEDAEIGKALAPYRVGGGDSIAFVPVSAASAWDTQWFNAMKAQGYTA